MAVTNPTPHAPRDVPVLVVSGGRGRLSTETLRENWEFREVFRSFVIRRVKVKYKQATVGIGWAVLQPMLAAAIFAVFFGHLAHVPSDGLPYLLFALAGTVVWSYFSSAAGLAMESLVLDQGLLKKVYFPREFRSERRPAVPAVRAGWDRRLVVLLQRRRSRHGEPRARPGTPQEGLLPAGVPI